MSWIARTGAVAAIVGIAGLAMTGPTMADTGDFGQQVLTMTAGSSGPSPCRRRPTWPNRCAAGVRPLLAELTRTGTHAMRSRGRKLLARLEQPGLTRRPARGIGGGMTQAGEDAVL
jgi:hypothetical protein